MTEETWSRAANLTFVTSCAKVYHYEYTTIWIKSGDCLVIPGVFDFFSLKKIVPVQMGAKHGTDTKK